MRKTGCYIDGFNIYHAINENCNPHLKWLNLWALAETLTEQGDKLLKVDYFTSLSTWSKSKSGRHKEYLQALDVVGVSSHVSKFYRVKNHCIEFKRYCKFYREKQSDVHLGISTVYDALVEGFGHIIFITADSDQVPPIKMIKSISPKTLITVAAPPKRWQHARELRGCADSFVKISSGRLERCLLPRNVKNSTGKIVARGPASYKPPGGWPT